MTPKPLQERPELIAGLEWAWEAFLALDRTRSAGLVPGAIRLAEIESYCRLRHIDDPEEIDELIRLVQALDHTMLTHHAKTAKAKAHHG